MHELTEVASFNALRIFWGHGQLPSTMRTKLVEFWQTNGAVLDPQEAWRRTFDIGCIVLNAEKEIVGVSSVYIDRLVKNGPAYWFYRTFIHARRRLLGLNPKIFHATFDCLFKSYGGELGSPAGIIVITENTKLESRGGVRILQRAGLERLGADPQGRSVWRKCFPPHFNII
jgi:hypothetical protein